MREILRECKVRDGVDVQGKGRAAGGKCQGKGGGWVG